MRDKVQKVAALGAVVRDFESKGLGTVPVTHCGQSLHPPSVYSPVKWDQSTLPTSTHTVVIESDEMMYVKQ